MNLHSKSFPSYLPAVLLIKLPVFTTFAQGKSAKEPCPHGTASSNPPNTQGFAGRMSKMGIAARKATMAVSSQ